MMQVLHPAKALELQARLAEPQSRAGLNEALTALKDRLDAAGLSYQDLSGDGLSASSVERRTRKLARISIRFWKSKSAK